jgi:transposase
VDVFVGLDWGQSHHQLHALDSGGNRLVSARVTHDRAGLAELRSVLERFAPADRVGIALERREGLLVDQLLNWGYPVFPVNPKVAARAREGYRAAPVKSDALDAFVLADLLRQRVRDWRPRRVTSGAVSELGALVRDRERFVVEHRRVQHQLRATLDTYYPAAPRLFTRLDSNIALAFMRRFPDPAALRRAGKHRLAAFLVRQGYTGRVSADQLWTRALAYDVDADRGMCAARRLGALALVRRLEASKALLGEYERAIAVAFRVHPDAQLFQSLPGTGLITAATLLAEIGADRARFPSAASLLAEAGLAPVTRQSGNLRRVGFRYAAKHHLRAAWSMWMLTLSRTHPWSAAAYTELRERGHRHNRAARSLGARWERIVWRCWQDRVPYDPARDTRVAAAA